ncbi:MAG: PEGA domain-containing protein [Magnetococcales bacterium]|nr:PEGA domain-containing protein [Magnetococcales bacterium]MBF0151246.1 PEGA domain-containing protein [Magnetococcales bacterium]MBF0174371.1 PEGA domain-containing protein [Magnetococcales bacterium]MBF0632794.1 PEGA domain-containing protein [Magnetococcales bacterium]
MPLPLLMAVLFLSCIAPAAMAQDDQTPQTTLLIKVIPRGAEVLVNEIVMGNAPFLIKKPPTGPIDLRARHMGYRSLGRRFNVIANKNNVAILILANRSSPVGTLTGSLAIDTAPQGANLFLDDTPLGRSPTRTENVLEGEYRIKADFPTLGEKTETVQVIANEVIRVTLRWNEPTPRGFRLDLIPGDARIQFLNYPQPYHSNMPLPKGRYLLRASHPDHVTTDIAVEMGEKDFYSLVKLQKKP